MNWELTNGVTISSHEKSCLVKVIQGDHPRFSTVEGLRKE